mgnify:CR=1 FL=1
MWGSLLAGDEYDIPFDTTGLDLDIVDLCGQLSQHPLMKATPPQQDQSVMGAPDDTGNPATASQGDGSLTPSATPKDTPDKQQGEQKRIQELAQQLGGGQQPQQPMAGPLAKSSIGWFDNFGKSAETIVKDIRRARRDNKLVKENIDDLIDAVRLMKQTEIHDTISSLSWSNGHESTIKSLGMSDRNIKALQKFGETRKSSLLRACLSWEAANERIDSMIDDGSQWTSVEKQEWVNAHNDRDDARKQWTNTLHALDTLNKNDMSWLTLAANQLEEHGQMDSRSIVSNLVVNGYAVKKMTPQKLSGLLKTYGGEIGIIKGVKRNHWMIHKDDGDLIIKDPWAYAAGFIDADGYITITKRGEPRVGLVATGNRGRIHCEQLHKTMGCGVLQLDLKVYKQNNRSQHRLQFYSKNDVRDVLKGIFPHLQLKKEQAKAVLEYLDTPRTGDIAKQRRIQLERLVKWENWSDTKGDELLSEWGVSAEAIDTWRDPTLMRLGIQAETLEELL